MSRMFIFVNIFSLLIATFGMYGVVTLSLCATATHGVATSSLFGAVFIYSMLEILFARFDVSINIIFI